MGVPEGGRAALHREAARRNEHVVSYVDVMRNYSEDLVRKKREDEKRKEDADKRRTAALPPSSVFPVDAIVGDFTDLSRLPLNREEVIKGVIIDSGVGPPQAKTKPRPTSSNPFEKRTAPNPPSLSEPKTKPKSKKTSVKKQ